jgi:hypothetical protein
MSVEKYVLSVVEGSVLPAVKDRLSPETMLWFNSADFKRYDLVATVRPASLLT